MDSILQSIEDWFRGLLVSGIMDNLSNTFESVNNQVGQIATEVGQTPANFSPAVYNMIRTLSENVIMPDCRIDTYVYRLLRADPAGHQP